ncbi:MAG TPA: 7TM-DISM domain-containing protein, partial [Saprospiraceae bacterium]|nr:7TM-DISM domain-containing protein [Saprospiraceae bacterium]
MMLRALLRLVCLLAISLAVCAPARGQRESPVLLYPGIFTVLNDSLEFFEDPSSSMGVEAVRSLPPTAFQNRQHLRFILGYSPGTLWARFRVANAHAQPQSVVIEVVNPFVPALGCYQVRPGQPADTLLLGGARWPFPHRHPDFQRRNFMCPLSVGAHDSCEVYLSISKDFLPNATILLTDRSIREGYVRRLEDILLTLFFVFCSVYLVLSAFIFTATRQRVQWYYFTYVLVTVCFVSSHLGHGFQYLWPHAPLLQFIIPPTLNLLRLIFGIRFFQLYFDIASRSRRLNLLFNSTMVFFALAPVAHLSYALCAFGHWDRLLTGRLYSGHQPFMYYAYLGFCLYLVLFSLTILAWAIREIAYRRRRHPVALFVVVSLNFVGLVLTALQYVGSNVLDLVPDALLRSNRLTYTTQTFYVPAPVLLGFFLEMLLVFNFSMRRYVRLFEKDQRAQLKVAKAREEGLNALLLG